MPDKTENKDFATEIREWRIPVFVATLNDDLCAFLSVLHFVHPQIQYRRISARRFVDWDKWAQDLYDQEIARL